MIITASVTISADINTVWDTLTDLTCWKDWNTVITDVTGEKPRKLTEGRPFNFCIRPFALPVRIEPIVDEVVPYKKITWSGKKFGVLARHDFFFEDSAGGVKVTSVETFTGLKLTLTWFKLSKWRLYSMTSLLLDELKKASELASQYR